MTAEELERCRDDIRGSSSPRRRRSRRSYAVEIAFTAAVVAALYFWITNGGPEWFGQWFAEYLTAPR
jgi:hypothetical protein